MTHNSEEPGFFFIGGECAVTRILEFGLVTFLLRNVADIGNEVDAGVACGFCDGYLNGKFMTAGMQCSQF